MELISINNVNVRYKNGVNAIHDLSIKIKKGDLIEKDTTYYAKKWKIHFY